jgi:hypothetical protein
VNATVLPYQHDERIFQASELLGNINSTVDKRRETTQELLYCHMFSDCGWGLDW